MIALGELYGYLSQSPEAVLSASTLRGSMFGSNDKRQATKVQSNDNDRFDSIYHHALIYSRDDSLPAATFRIRNFSKSEGVSGSYAAQFYDLSGLDASALRMVEIGRFCVNPSFRASPDVLRLALGLITQHVDDHGADLLFGCASFRGTQPTDYADALACLVENYPAPENWNPGQIADDIFELKRLGRAFDRKRALLQFPPLLRSYLSMGCWVSDHAVIDRQLETFHVFTGLEIAKIPTRRAQTLRALSKPKLTAGMAHMA
jgi:putative hemolysin